MTTLVLLVAKSPKSATILKNTSAIRDLIVVSRTFLDSQKEATAQIQKLQDAQQATNEKLRALIDR